MTDSHCCEWQISILKKRTQRLQLFNCSGFIIGVITTNQVSLSSSFLADPPTFTLMGETRGGPPTTFHWRRNGVEITNSSLFTISISLKNVEERFTESVYVSTLVVRGNLPGVRTYICKQVLVYCFNAATNNPVHPCGVFVFVQCKQCMSTHYVCSIRLQ